MRRWNRQRSESVHIEYDPEHDGDADPGEIVWTWVAYEEDPSQGKDRPVLVIARRERQVAAVMLTSKDHREDPDYFFVGNGTWDAQRRPSYAKLDRVLWFGDTAYRREGAVLDRNRFDALVIELRGRHGDW